MTPNSHRWRADTARCILHKCISEKSGVAAIEFAILAPLLFLILIGILVYGLYFGTVHAVQQLAADSARASIAGLTDAERTTLAAAHAQTSAGNYLLLDQSRMSINTGTDSGDGSIFVVTIIYDASNLPIFGLDGLVPVPSQSISRSATIRRGSY